MILRPSALKQGISEEAAVFAATNGCRFTASLDDDHPQREFRLGFDQSMCLLELVVLRWDDQTEEIIHAMKARRTYQRLLE